MSPVAQGIKVAEVETILQAEFNTGKGTGDLSGNKGLSPERAFMIEENTIAGVDPIGLTKFTVIQYA